MTTQALTLPKFAQRKTVQVPAVLAPVVLAPTVLSPLTLPRVVAKTTPRITPRTTPRNVDDDNPWLPQKVDGAGTVQIVAITPLGNIKAVPTSDVRPQTPRRTLPAQRMQLNVVNTEASDSVWNATIYLNVAKPEDQDYNYIAQRMHAITAATHTFQHQFKTQLRPLPNIRGCVRADIFETALSIYENNQVYYQDRIDDKTLTEDDIRTNLNELEYWFMQIIEPRPKTDVAEWSLREKNKVIHGRSGYCDETLHDWVAPAPTDIRDAITRYHTQIF